MKQVFTNLTSIVALSLGIQSAFAGAREEIIHSRFGGNPYLVVYDDEHGQSTRPPGIYTRTESHHWQLLLQGEAFLRPVAGGLSLELDIAELTGRYESVAILNGRVNLFSVRSDARNPASFIDLGSDNARIRDPLTHQYIKIPPIQNIRDVTVYQTTVEDNYQVILVSIRNPNNAQGDGVTFAVVLDIDSNVGSENKELKMLYDPILLDWNFAEDTSALSQRLYLPHRGESAGFISRNFMLQYSINRKSDNAVIAEWRHQIREFLAGKIDYTFFGDKHGSDLPYLQIKDGELQIDRLPNREVNVVGLQISAIFDPISGREGLYNQPDDISLRGIDSNPPVIRGSVLIQNDALAITEENSTISANREIAFIRMQDGRIYLGAHIEEGAFDHLLLSPTIQSFVSQKPIEISWGVVSLSKFLLISWKFEKQEFTSLYEIETTGPQLRIKAQSTISNKFYNSEELNRRVSLQSGIAVFDDLTPLLATDDEYEEQHRLTAPHIDLKGSLRTKSIRHFFPKPLFDKLLTSRLEFREYERADGIEAKTGIYLVRHDKESDEEREKVAMRDPLLRGQWIHSLPEAMKDGLLGTTIIKTEKDADVNVGAFLFDHSGKSGKGGQIVLYFSPDPTHIAPSLHIIQSQPIPVDQITSFGFITHQPPPPEENREEGKKAKSKTELEMEKRKRDELRKYISFYVTFKSGQTQIVEMEVNKIDDKRGHQITSTVARSVADSELNAAEIYQRLMFDDQGKMYWVLTPEIERGTRKYKVKRISDDKAVVPYLDKSVRLHRIHEEAEAQGPVYIPGTWYNYETQALRDAKIEEQRKRLQNAAEYQLDIFPQLNQLVDDLVNPDKMPRHIVYIVPNDLLTFVKEYPLALRDREDRRLPNWQSSNPKHDLIIPPVQGATQSEVLHNLDTLRERSRRKRAMFMLPIDQLRAAGRPVIDNADRDEDKFFIREQRLTNSVSSSFDREKNGNNASTDRSEKPHLLYLLSTEGEKINISQFRPGQSTKSMSMLLVGTEEQWNTLISEAGFEEEYGVSKDWEKVMLQPPTAEVRTNFAIRNVLRHPVVQNLGYKIDIKGIVSGADAAERYSVEEAEQKLMTYLIYRADRLAVDNKQPIFESFLKVLNELETQLVGNKTLRMRRVIDHGVLEVILSRLFPMSLNINLLPETDPLRILSREDADFLWQKAGYPGPIALKERVLKTILSQLDTDNIRNLKSSMILFGGTGSGKTSAVKTLFKMLNEQSGGLFKEYDFKADSLSQNAWAFFLPMSKIISSEGSRKDSQGGSETMMTFQQAKEHFDAFLASENGPRGFICLDDIHLAPDEVRGYFLSKIRSLQDEPTYKTSRGDRPTRNITIFLTLNPTDNQDRIKRFAKNAHYPEMVDVLLATLSSGTGTNDIDRSFLARFSEPINLSYFPVGAKGPALLKTLNESRQAAFANRQRLMFVSSDAINEVIKKFPMADARTFLSSASSAILNLPRGEGEKLFMIVPRQVSIEPAISIDPSVEYEGPIDEFSMSGGDQGRRIERHVQTHLRALAVGEGYNGRLEFLNYLISNFRLKVFEFILKTISENRAIMRSPTKRQMIVVPLAQSIYRHLLEHPEPYLKEVVLDPIQFGATTSNQRVQFQEAMQNIVHMQELRNTGQTKLPGIGEPSRLRFSEDFTQVHGSTHLSRSNVLHENTNNLTGWLDSLMSEFLNMSSSGQDKMNAHAWITSNLDEPKNLESLGEDFVSQLDLFLTRIFDPRIDATKKDLSQYDAMRFFVLTVDKAIYRLPWAKLLNFTLNGIKEVTADMSLGQSPKIQDMLFKNALSPLIPVDLHLVLGFASSMPSVEDLKDSERIQAKDFHDNCASLLARVGESQK